MKVWNLRQHLAEFWLCRNQCLGQILSIFKRGFLRRKAFTYLTKVKRNGKEV